MKKSNEIRERKRYTEGKRQAEEEKRERGSCRCRSLSGGSPISETITILLSVVAEASGPGRWQERERPIRARQDSRVSGETRRERRPAGLRAQERLLPTLNAVLMPATTGLPPLQRRTCSRNRFSSFSAQTRLSRLSESRSLSSSAVFGTSLSLTRSDHFRYFTLARGLSLSLVRFSPLSFFVLSFCGVPQFLPRLSFYLYSLRHSLILLRSLSFRACSFVFCFLFFCGIFFRVLCGFQNVFSESFALTVLHTNTFSINIFSLLSISRTLRMILFWARFISLSKKLLAARKAFHQRRAKTPFCRNFARFQFENRHPILSNRYAERYIFGASRDPILDVCCFERRVLPRRWSNAIA